MKKVLFMISVATFTLMGCTNESSEYVGSGPEQKEIAFMPLTQPTTRAAVEGTTFPNISMQVAAYDVTHTRDFFTGTEFTKSSTTWKGGKYWPLSPAYINFLAYANLTGTAKFGNELGTPVDAASKVVLSQTDNYSTQTDVMFAIGNGEVQQSGNTLTFPTNVPMQFKHAQAYMVFNVKAADDASQAIHITNIEIKDAYFAGTATVTHTNYNASASQSVSVAWTDQAKHGDAYYTVVSGAPINYTLTTSSVKKGEIMVVPAATAFSKIRISYTLDSKAYTYEYEPASKLLEAGKKYIYDITFKLHEIEIAPTVEDWLTTTYTEYVNIPTMNYGANPTYALANGAKGTYTFTITGLTEGHFVKVTDDHATTGKFTVTSPASTYTVTANGTVTITGTLADNGGSAATSVITLKQYPTSDDASAGTNEEATFATTITITQAGS